MWKINLILILVLSVHGNYDDLSLKKCNHQSWTIHGWWPEYNGTSWPEYCKPSRYNEFNKTIIDPIIGQLKQYWMPCPEWDIIPYDFWQHEWRKHGTCTNMTAYLYFSYTLNIYNNVRVLNYYNCCTSGNQCLLHFEQGKYFGCKYENTNLKIEFINYVQ